MRFTFLGKVIHQKGDYMKYIIYTDGSYKEVPELGAYASAAATITRSGETEPITVLNKVFKGDMLSMRNVAGEIVAVMMAAEHCVNELHAGMEDELVIYHDYSGIDSWCKRVDEKGYWRAKNPWTQKYRSYMNDCIKTRTRVTFIHVKGHSGVAGNTYVDQVARDSINRHFDKLRGEMYEHNL